MAVCFGSREGNMMQSAATTKIVEKRKMTAGVWVNRKLRIGELI
jgi:hypothetical protein